MRSALQHLVLQVTSNATSEMRSALQHRVLQVTMQCDIRNAIRTTTPGIASYYEMRHQKCDPHYNTGYCKLLCNATSEMRSALQHHVLQVMMKCDIRNAVRTPTPGIASYYVMGYQSPICTPTPGIVSY